MHVKGFFSAAYFRSLKIRQMYILRKVNTSSVGDSAMDLDLASISPTRRMWKFLGIFATDPEATPKINSSKKLCFSFGVIVEYYRTN